MKTRICHILGLAATFILIQNTSALSTVFTYQGRLASGSSEVTGRYDFQFQMFNASGSGTMLASFTTNNIAVSNGLFAVSIDFGSSYDGNERWMEIAVKTNGTGAYTTLAPRQQLTATPHALYSASAGAAATASQAAAVQANAVTGAGIASNQVVRSINGLRDNVVIPTNFWSLAGNTGTGTTNFIGTMDTQPLQFRVGNLVGLRLVNGANAPSVLGGPTNNVIHGESKYNIIGSGNNNAIPTNVYQAGILGGYSNRIDKLSADWWPDGAFIGGGYMNTCAGMASMIPGGYNNTAYANYSFAAGFNARAMHQATFVWSDGVLGDFASTTDRQFLIRAGHGVGINTNNPQAALHVAGTVIANNFVGQATGLSGTITNSLTFDTGSAPPFKVNSAQVVTNLNADLLDGRSATNFWMLGGNDDFSTNAVLGTLNSQPLELRVNNVRGMLVDHATRGSMLSYYYSINLLGGSRFNTMASDLLGATIAGGGYHYLSGMTTYYHSNSVTDDFGTVGGGYDNLAGYAATVPGGRYNVATGAASFAAGSHAHATHDYSFVWSDGNDNYSTGPNRFEVFAVDAINLISTGVGVGVTEPQQMLSVSLGMNIDQNNANTGTIANTLRFGDGSGEGIGSKRNASGNQYGLDFYTASVNRMAIQQDGDIGIGSTSPEQKVDVNGRYLQVRGSGGERAYLGGDGVGSDAQFGSLSASVTNAVFWNAAINDHMNLYVKTITIMGGADLAEPFDVSGQNIPKGAVMIIDDANPGRLKMSSEAYDTRVAGIVSGANGIAPGIHLKQAGKMESGENIALSGRVYALADAGGAPIKPGDLLTTSATPGHVMKASDPARATGAIIGKAMSALPSGTGYVLVLVNLQ